MRSQIGEGLPSIPAMTTDAEREYYYRIVRENAHRGAVVELGPWLGASTTYIAAGMRDAGAGKAHVYDRFKLNSEHLRKAKGHNLSTGPCLDEFRKNLGPLMEFVEPHPGEIENLKWTGGKISVLICDAPKRVAVISAVLTKFRKSLPGAAMAWQDFCHFPSYEIPACLYRIRHHLEFIEAVVPGTTMAFRVKAQWEADEVSPEVLALDKWTPEEIGDAWDYWLDFVAPEKRALFECGEAMFLCDIGKPDHALEILINLKREPTLQKWRYLREARPGFVTRYAPLFEYLERQGVFESEPV